MKLERFTVEAFGKNISLILLRSNKNDFHKSIFDLFLNKMMFYVDVLSPEDQFSDIKIDPMLSKWILTGFSATIPRVSIS